MTFRIALTALALSALPVVAVAQGCDHEKAQSCAAGSSWDEATKSCVKQITS